MKRFQRLKIAFIVIIIIWILLIVFKSHIEPFCKSYFGDGFLVSYSASLLEDIVFFGLIGYITIYITTKLPEDENLITRIKSLANNKSVGDKAKTFLFDYVKKLLVYSSHHNVNVVIKEFDRDTNSIKIFCDFSGDLVNMCKDEVYSFLDFAFIVEPNERINNSYGYISYIGIEDVYTSNNQIIIQNDIVELKNNKTFEKYISFDISRNSSAKWRMSFATWGKLDNNKSKENNWFFLRCSTFTERFTAIINNETEIDIKCDIRYPNRDNNSGSKIVSTDGIVARSNTGNTILGNNIVFYPKDKFEIYFYN